MKGGGLGRSGSDDRLAALTINATRTGPGPMINTETNCCSPTVNRR
jgi:hypothetical protein